MGYQCKNPFVCCLFVYLHFRQSLISVAVCGFKYRLEGGKVFGVNTLQGRKIHPETACRPTFQLSNEVCTSFADEQRKWVNGGIGKLIYHILMIDQFQIFQILPCNNEKCTVLLLVHKKVVPLFQDELYINANHASM